MFEDSLIESGGRRKTKRGATTAVSFIFQVILIGLLVLVPLIFTEALPKQQLMTFLVAPPPPPPPPPPPAAVPIKTVKVVQTDIVNGQLRTPTKIPENVQMVKEEEAPPQMAGVAGGVPGGVAGGTMGGVLGGIVGSSLPPRQITEQAAAKAGVAHQMSEPEKQAATAVASLRRGVEGAPWMALAMMVQTRMWLGGEVSEQRDMTLIRRLIERVRRSAAHRPLLCCTDGLCTSIRAMRESGMRPDDVVRLALHWVRDHDLPDREPPARS